MTTPKELVRRLREANDNPSAVTSWRDLVAEAADLIERLQRELADERKWRLESQRQHVEVEALLFACQGERDEARKDAERYRWLREQHWEKAALAVVRNPRQAVKLGHDLPSLDRLDEAVDAAIDAAKEGK